MIIPILNKNMIIVVGLFCDVGLGCLLLYWVQVFWIRELGPVQLYLTLVWLVHKLCPICQSFGHMPMASGAACKENGGSK